MYQITFISSATDRNPAPLEVLPAGQPHAEVPSPLCYASEARVLHERPSADCVAKPPILRLHLQSHDVALSELHLAIDSFCANDRAIAAKQMQPLILSDFVHEGADAVLRAHSDKDHLSQMVDA